MYRAKGEMRLLSKRGETLWGVYGVENYQMSENET